jgi:NAD+ kinase
MRLQRVWLIYRADSPLALKEARRCADELETIGVTTVLAMSGLTADPFPGLLASEPRLPDLAVVLVVMERCLVLPGISRFWMFRF